MAWNSAHGLQDVRCRIMRNVYYFASRGRCWNDSLLNYLIFKLWGIQCGQRNRFYGLVRVNRHPESTLEIGDQCTFRSRATSNLIGINRPCILSTLRPGANLKLGNNIGLSGVVISAAQSIIIEDNVLVGANSTITDTDWHGINPDMRRSDGECAPVHIMQNVWIGLNCIVLKGVTIGEHSVIGAGSVVTSNVPDRVISAGVPARTIKKLT